MLEVDAFEKLLVLAGLGDSDVLPPRVNPFTPEEAGRLMALLVQTPVTLGNFPPRMAVGHLLRGVLEGGEVSRAELLRRVERFQGVAVLRPDGYLAWVRNGRTQQRVAEMEWREGAFRAHGFELGRFYGSRGGVFRLLDAQFRELNEGAYAEVYDDADVVSRTLDGAEEAFVELYHALGRFFTYPTDSILALRHLPAGVAALIASSPEYWERFRYMTAGEQMKAVARLSTSLLIAGGSANGVTRTLTSAMGGAEAMVPVLSLSAQGALAIQRVAVPVGKVATAVGYGVGGVYVLSSGASDGARVSSQGQMRPSAEELLQQAVRRPPEKVSGFRIFGNKGLVGTTFQRNILLIEAEVKGAAPLRELIAAFEAEARAAGATRLSITGHAVVNQGFLKPAIAQRFGFSLRRIGDDAIELVKDLTP
ncbi:hypothetical protein JQX13_53385 [Archangium violaceum]|nr:hypothetical protein JQX13_53385 [Archangium violaceum]